MTSIISSEPLSDQQQTAVIQFTGTNLDASNIKAFKQELFDTLDRFQIVLIDMEQLTFVDSSGLGALLSALRTMNHKHGQLKLFALNPPVRSLFELVRMNRVFSIYETREQAIQSLHD